MDYNFLHKDLIEKYNVPGPRYTSYPTVPEWSDDIDGEIYASQLRAFANSDKGLSLYIHIPFCESMCYYCACMVQVRKQRPEFGDEYLDYLFKEMDMLLSETGTQKSIHQLHLGGGTPTFLSEEQLQRLMDKITSVFHLPENAEIAIELDPRTVDVPKLAFLRNLGFNRVSMGVQDFDPEVQKSINRIQSFESVKELTEACRALAYESVNYDLIYGLPKQSLESFAKTIAMVKELRPDRIALYSFAFLPWMAKHRLIEESSLPETNEKLDIFLQARNTFLEVGYSAIGMDHFALEEDQMTKAYNAGVLHRNFMGYTLQHTTNFIGLGVSSIGFVNESYIQNTKQLKRYYQMLDAGKFPVERGKLLDRDDQIRRWLIQSIMCRFVIDKQEFQEVFQEDFDTYFAAELNHIVLCRDEALLKETPLGWEVSELGKLFVRNICMGFDWYLCQQDGHRRFSKTI